MVKKRDGRTEEFDKEKVMASMEKACQKRPVTQEQVENLVDSVVEELFNTFDRDVPYEEIGVRVMQGLRALDGVAYVRYASVYRRFEEANEFVNEVKKLEKRDDPLTARLPGI
jgi:transcriptional repressor NrdR